MDYLSEILKGFLTVCLVMGCYYYANRRGVESKDSKLMQQGKVIGYSFLISIFFVALGYNKKLYPFKLWITYMLTVTVLTGLIGLADGWKQKQDKL